MALPTETRRATRDSVQPSLWDRLIDDVPGLVVETEHLQKDLSEELGAERVEALLDGGDGAIRRATDLDADQTKRILHLERQRARRRHLEEKGVVVSAEVLRQAVRRDIEALFNTERLEADYLFGDREQRRPILSDLSDFPEVQRSVINYGMPSFAGKSARDFDRAALAKEVREILALFEPRLTRDSIRVRVTSGEKTGLRIDIDALLIMAPVPERLRLMTEIDLDTGLAATRLETR